MTDEARTAALVAAALASGLQAGVYYAFACSVIPGLRRGDPRVLVAALQQVNIAIVNPWFLATFLGAPLLAAVASALCLGRPGFGWVLAGFLLATATLVITVAVNVPLNNALAAAGDATTLADPAVVVDRFEPAWSRWNAVRALTSTAALACLCLAAACG
ncbi:MAG: anthrone oxygenase family protein [Pseudonocardia sp.]